MSTSREPVVAWRSWQVSNGYLLSCSTTFVWPPKMIIPGEDEGFFAYKTEAQAVESNYHNNGGVLGEVLLWGHIYEYTEGYRAQFAYPKRLYYLDDMKEINLMNLGQYGVPIERYGKSRKELESALQLALAKQHKLVRNAKHDTKRWWTKRRNSGFGIRSFAMRKQKQNANSRSNNGTPYCRHDQQL